MLEALDRDKGQRVTTLIRGWRSQVGDALTEASWAERARLWTGSEDGLIKLEGRGGSRESREEKDLVSSSDIVSSTLSDPVRVHLSGQARSRGEARRGG